VVTEGIVGAP